MKTIAHLKKNFFDMRMTIFLAFLVITSFLGIKTQAQVFPSDAWGTFSWATYKSNEVSKALCPNVKGVPIILWWSGLEPNNDQFEFQKQIRDKLELLAADNLYAFISVWAAPATSSVLPGDTTWFVTPKWLFSSGVSLVEFPNTLDALDRSTVRFFPFYLDPEYEFYYYRMIDKLGAYLLSLPANLRNRVLFVQSAEGSTGDPGAYKGTPINANYNISDAQWKTFKEKAWQRYVTALSQNGDLKIPLLTNWGELTLENCWMLDNLPKAVGVKNGLLSHGYQLTEDIQTFSEFKTFKTNVESRGKVFFAQGEMDDEYNTYGWISQNIPQGLYWSGIYATMGGLTVWNNPSAVLQNTNYQDGALFFNRYAGQFDPATANYGFCALRQGLDAADVIRFPVASYGGYAATKTNVARYTAIKNAFSSRGAQQADQANAMNNPIDARHASGFNDVGWQTLPGNYYRHITQINADETSIGWWSVDGTIYGRFARGFENSSGKNAMYFDVDNNFFGTNKTAVKSGIKIKVIYKQSDTGSWKLKYHASDGTMKTAYTQTNSGTGWATRIVTINNAMLSNGGANGSDLILENAGATNCRFHLIEIDKSEVTYIRPVTSVSISPTTASLTVGQTSQLTATVLPTNATNKSVTWTSSNIAVVTVSTSGLATAVSTGNATITVTTVDGSKTATCAVTVSSIPSVQAPYGGSNRSIPGLIEAEHFDEGGEGYSYHDDATKQGDLTIRAAEKVDLLVKSNTAKDVVIGYPVLGEWLEYSVDTETAKYDMTLKYFCNTTSAVGDLKVILDDVVLGTFTDIVTQGSNTKQAVVTVPNISISAGKNKILRLEYVNGVRFDIDAILFTKSAMQSKAVAGINENPKDVDAISVYPNPVSSILHINFPDAASNKEIKLFNSVGQLVFSTKTTEANVEVDVKSMGLKGSVVVQVISGNDVLSYRVVVK